MHRLRRLRGGLQKQLGHAFCERESLPACPAAARRAGAKAPCRCHARADGCRRIWRLLQHVRLRSRMPQRNLGAPYRSSEPGAYSSEGGIEKGLGSHQMPFTREQFLNVFQQYNLALWPMQVVLILLGLTAIYF